MLSYWLPNGAKQNFFGTLPGTWTAHEEIKHKQRCYGNAEIVPLVIWVVLCSLYFCGIFGNVMALGRPQSKQAKCKNIKYKIYFNHKTKKIPVTKCLGYSIFLTHVNISRHCRSNHAASISHRISKHNMEREEREVKLVLRLKV